MRTSPEMHGSNRCQLFEEIAHEVWERIIYSHEVGVDLDERGITKDILVDLLHFSKRSTPNFDVFARPSYDEATYGSDLDLFVEYGVNNYIWYALQAKILKTNKRYTTLRDSSDGFMQWDKLSLLEGLTGCKAYYLLYNGDAGYTYTGTDACSRPFLEHQFGCSLVEPNRIQHFADLLSSTGRFIRPRFTDIHHQEAQPWRILVCCYQETEGLTSYQLEEILASNGDRVQAERLDLDGNGIDPKGSSDENESDSDQNSKPASGRIHLGSSEVKWDPDIRIVVHTTKSLMQK